MFFSHINVSFVLKILFIYFYRGREGEGEGEKRQCVVASSRQHRPAPHPRLVP